MKPFKNYIATWFYRESHEEASYYPQAGGRGDSALLHSVYMQIQVPFFTTFRHYNPEAELLFFSNLEPILCIRHLQGNGETHATWRHVVGL